MRTSRQRVRPCSSFHRGYQWASRCLRSAWPNPQRAAAPRMAWARSRPLAALPRVQPLPRFEQCRECICFQKVYRELGKHSWVCRGICRALDRWSQPNGAGCQRGDCAAEYLCSSGPWPLTSTGIWRPPLKTHSVWPGHLQDRTERSRIFATIKLTA